jgi:oxygen-independent coproporphyrinogen III oxidase
MFKPPVGLYVHVPFCSIKCFYCDFTAFAGQNKTADRYLAALEREASLMPKRVPSTLYVGGGTPSELTAPQIETLFALVRRAYPESRFVESTFEANPESLSQDKIAALKAAGLTRLSLGLQTADDALLKGIGRRHTFSDFIEVFGRAREAGFAVSVDLMYGLPGQTLQGCVDSLDKVLALKPEHLSLYGLQVEDRTLFAKRGVDPDEDLGREMFEASLDRLTVAGFHHYEISNFSRPGHESVHNQIYWNNGEYVGLGCGAASSVDGRRWTNIDRLVAYCEAVDLGRRPIDESEQIEGRARLGEEVLLRLRLIDGFAPTREMREAFASQWDTLRRRGLVRDDGARVALTREGIFLANQVFSEFVAPFPEVAAL